MKSKNIKDNKKVSFDFEILDSYEAGIALRGHEVKSIRQGNVNIRGSYASVRGSEIFLCDMTVARFNKTGKEVDEKRDRKLLLKKREILKIQKSLDTKGVTCMIKRIYLKRGLIKAEIVVARGRKKHDKRRLLRERSLDREAAQAMKKRIRT